MCDVLIKIILIGANGKMGSAITDTITNDKYCEIVAGVDKYKGIKREYPVYDNATLIQEDADVIIDFSNPEALGDVLEFATTKKIPLVIGTTGLDEKQSKAIENASKIIAVFSSFNMSLGVNLLLELSKKAAQVLGNDFDIEIIEKHHNQKIDAPSGTAFMVANAINDTLKNSMKYEYDRHSKREKRNEREIGIHSVRGGNIVGEHEVIFAGNDEIITISHSARSKALFATGAVNAAKFLAGKDSGIYSMKDLIG